MFAVDFCDISSYVVKCIIYSKISKNLFVYNCPFASISAVHINNSVELVECLYAAGIRHELRRAADSVAGANNPVSSANIDVSRFTNPNSGHMHISTVIFN